MSLSNEMQSWAGGTGVACGSSVRERIVGWAKRVEKMEKNLAEISVKASGLYQLDGVALDEVLMQIEDLATQTSKGAVEVTNPELYPIPVPCAADGGSCPMCTSKECQNWESCAQHDSAGDWRTDDGDAPDLVLIEGVPHCSGQLKVERVGALCIEKGRLVLVRRVGE